MTCEPSRKEFDPEMLDVGMFSHDDLANLALQRSDVLAEIPQFGKLIRAWEAGDHAPLEAEVDRMGADIAIRAARIIAAEFDSVIGQMDRIRPGRLADIGCGYAMFDLFAYRRYDCDLLLIDIEETEHRHFGYETEGAAYTSLPTARKFLAANGVPTARVRTWNPEREDPPDLEKADLVVSLLSCGFHFPVDMYMPFFRFGVRPGGTIILDLRMGKAPHSVQQLRRLGKLTTLSRENGVRRVLIDKKRKK